MSFFRTHIAAALVAISVSLTAARAAEPIAPAALPTAAATLQNQAFALDFDLGRGTYSVSQAGAAKPFLSGASVAVEGWASSDAGTTCKIAEKTATRMLLECARAEAPTLLLEITLHPTFVELRSGVKNLTAAPIRIKKMGPLTGATVFPGGDWADVRTLDAPSGVKQPTVSDSAVRSSPNNLLLTCKQEGIRRSLVLGALKTADFTKWAHLGTGNRASLEAYDPIGRVVDPGETYFPADSFYIDATVADPFAALEKYGLALREATGASKLNPYDFPTVCAWYVGIWKVKDAAKDPAKSKYKINTSAGLVAEAQAIKKSGFTNYSRAAVRLVPDIYAEYNPQGWWDDAHWQSKRHGGYYTAPYETSAKLGQAVHENGCLAFTYIQPQVHLKHKLSRDFREAHPDWLLGVSARNALDYSRPEVQDYMRQKFGALRGHLDGLMVDYVDQFWLSTLYGKSPEPRLALTAWESIRPNDKSAPSPFVDPKMTATGFYRQFFRSIKDGLGPNSWIHERNLEQPNNDLALGLVDSQRTTQDSDKISPAVISRSGLRWYKNRVVLAYDMDGKNLMNAWKPTQSGLEKHEGFKGWSGTDQEGRRMTLTMAYVAASRLLLTKSFREFTPEIIHDLARTFPYPTEARSARPIDAFSHAGLPRIYDFAVTPDWHQVTLFNNTLPTRTETLSVPLSGENIDGALALDPTAQYHVYDFWNDTFVGTLKGSDTLKQTLRPGEARMLSIRKVLAHPQVLSTNRHLMQGYYELSDVKWSGTTLSGKAKVVANEPFKLTIALNGRQPTDLTSSANGQLAVLTIKRPSNETVNWSIQFK